MNHGSFMFYDGGFIMEDIDISDSGNIIKLLNSVIDRIDKITLCLPDMLQINMEEARNNVSCLLNKLHYNGNDFRVEKLYFLDNVSLYMELNEISCCLGICMLLYPFNTLLEDAHYNIEFIMKKMAFYDSVFSFCYEKGNKRILK